MPKITIMKTIMKIIIRVVLLVFLGAIVASLLKATVFHDTEVGGVLHAIIIIVLLVIGTKDLWMTATQKHA
jgi:hypothetical protein